MRRANLAYCSQEIETLTTFIFWSVKPGAQPAKANFKARYETQTKPIINGQAPVPHGEIVGLSNGFEIDQSEYLQETLGVTLKKYRS